ncbi:MAG: NAD(P)(+) transhydrogenase (Re/Si-specific) subunit beta [Thermodesulfobacteriota bacterium]
MSAQTNLIYLVAAVLFIFGLKMLSSPRTARRGNMLAMLGMLIAIVITLLDRQIISWPYIMVGIIIGSAVGYIAAQRVALTEMPQMVAVFNGLGGGASMLVAFAEVGPRVLRLETNPELYLVVTIVLSVLIGTVTLTGSMVAYAKLQGLLTGAPIVYRGQHVVNVILIVVCAVLGIMMAFNPSMWLLLVLVFIIAAVLGVSSVIRIGGADMPVVIALLNSYSGLAAAATGFVISNNVLIISGALVGASGLILTKIMCVAMNRSLVNVLFGAVGTAGGTGVVSEEEKKSVTRYTPMDAALMLENAYSVIIIPGYGLAVAQAQHVLQEGAKLLMDKGIKVRYAIHPVAGRMPGHMNVLLAEANVPYDLLLDMTEINEDFKDTDIVLVIGANDVINPAARYKKGSPLYGMPILNADQARTVIICKRSLSPGFSGEDNELFYDDKTMMVFGDAKKTVTDITNIIKSA